MSAARGLKNLRPNTEKYNVPNSNFLPMECGNEYMSKLAFRRSPLVKSSDAPPPTEPNVPVPIASNKPALAHAALNSRVVDTFTSLPDDFDWTTYVDLNPDVSHQLNTESKAVMHWINYGRNEGRSYKYDLPDDFDWCVYLKLNPDLRVTTGSTKKEIVRHYIDQGRTTGRPYKITATPKEWGFKWREYAVLHDLGAGCDKEQAWRHYTTKGYLEDLPYHLPFHAFDWAKLRPLSEVKNTVLVITDRDPDKERFLIDLTAHYDTNVGVLALRALHPNVLSLSFGPYFSFSFVLPRQFDDLVGLIRDIQPRFAHINVWRDLHPWTEQLLAATGLPHVVSVHDPMACVEETARWLPLLEGSKRNFVSNELSHTTLKRFFANVTFRVAPYEEVELCKAYRPVSLADIMHIAVLQAPDGNTLSQLDALAQSAIDARMNATFLYIGDRPPPSHSPMANVTYIDRHSTIDELTNYINYHKIDLFLFFPTVSACYDYGITDAMAYGLLVVAPNIECYAERLVGYQNKILYADTTDPVTKLVELHQKHGVANHTYFFRYPNNIKYRSRVNKGYGEFYAADTNPQTSVSWQTVVRNNPTLFMDQAQILVAQPNLLFERRLVTRNDLVEHVLATAGAEPEAARAFNRTLEDKGGVLSVLRCLYHQELGAPALPALALQHGGQLCVLRLPSVTGGFLKCLVANTVRKLHARWDFMLMGTQAVVDDVKATFPQVQFLTVVLDSAKDITHVLRSNAFWNELEYEHVLTIDANDTFVMRPQTLSLLRDLACIAHPSGVPALLRRSSVLLETDGDLPVSVATADVNELSPYSSGHAKSACVTLSRIGACLSEHKINKMLRNPL